MPRLRHRTVQRVQFNNVIFGGPQTNLLSADFGRIRLPQVKFGLRFNLLPRSGAMHGNTGRAGLTAYGFEPSASAQAMNFRATFWPSVTPA